MDLGGDGIDIDGNGIVGGGGGGGGAPHLTVQKEIALGVSVNRKVETWQGPFVRLLEKAKGYSLGTYVEDEGLPAGNSDTQGGGCGYAFVSDVKLTRGNGNVGRLVVTLAQNRQAARVAVDFTEVQRPIRSWHADKADGAPDLAKIREWEAKEESDYASYASFAGLDGDTKTLAEMIFKGIEHFTVYAPVVSVSLVTFSFPQLSLYPVGKQYGEPEVPYGWDILHGGSISDVVQNLTPPDRDTPYMWVLGSSRATPNADGTYQWTLQYQACDSVEEALFA